MRKKTTLLFPTEEDVYEDARTSAVYSEEKSLLLVYIKG